MTRTFAEILLFASLAMNAALLLFIAGVLRKVMNDMDESALKQFVVCWFVIPKSRCSWSSR
jgi:hypothetical protein